MRQRYHRLWALVASAAERCDTTNVYDNSAISGPRIVTQLVQGIPVGSLRWPTWAPDDLTARWPSDPVGSSRPWAS